MSPLNRRIVVALLLGPRTSIKGGDSGNPLPPKKEALCSRSNNVYSSCPFPPRGLNDPSGWCMSIILYVRVYVNELVVFLDFLDPSSIIHHIACTVVLSHIPCELWLNSASNTPLFFIQSTALPNLKTGKCKNHWLVIWWRAEYSKGWL